jgi:TfoX/Sxy family transcriptional regulator of competence genes
MAAVSARATDAHMVGRPRQSPRAFGLSGHLSQAENTGQEDVNRMASDPWRKARPEDVERFREAIAGIDGLEQRQMFGFPAVFLGGNMVAGLHQESVMVRLPEAERQAQLDAGWSLFEPMPGRPMREYVALPPDVFADVGATRGWIERAAAHVRTLPPKAPKPRKRKG